MNGIKLLLLCVALGTMLSSCVVARPGYHHPRYHHPHPPHHHRW